MRVVAAVLAAGKGKRFGGDKMLSLLGGKPVWRWSFDTFVAHPLVDAVGLVVPPGQSPRYPAPEASFVIDGGNDRQESSRKAVEASDGDIVLLQDAARPFTSPEVIERVILAVRKSGAAAPATPIPDTLRTRIDDGYQLVDRSRTVAMQTPQGGLRSLLLDAHRQAKAIFTDDMSLIEAIGERCEIVEGDSSNFKITTTTDLERARAMVGGVETRTGVGYDIHRFSNDTERPLILGGVRFGGPGMEGHSDADVVIHAAVDALLGAAALGDIGQHFPNTDPRWAGEPSRTFLNHAASLLREGGWRIVNIDITMIGEKPKVMGQAHSVRAFLAEALGIDAGRVSFKATTNEGLGSLGRGEGIAAYAVATIREGA